MSDFLYYCGKCNSLVADTYEDDSITCEKCGGTMAPLHIDEEEWNNLTTEEKQTMLVKYRQPQIQKRRSSVAYSAGNRVKSVSESEYTNSNIKKDYYGKISGMSITAFVFSLLGCLGLVGVILGIVDVTREDGRKKGLSIAAIVIGAIMLIGSISYAASSGNSDENSKKNISTDNINTESSSLDSGGISVEGSVDISDKTKNEIIRNDDSMGETATIEQQVLIEQEGVKVTAVEYVQGGLFGDGVKLLIENNTSQNLTVGCDALIVNDYMLTDLFACNIAAGKQAYETLDLYTSELKKAGINNVGLIEAYFRVYDSDTWDNLFKTQCITIKTSNFDSMDTSTDINGTELVNQDGIRIVGQYVDENSFWGAAVLLYIENNSDNNVTINVDNMSVNGFMVTPFFSSTVYSGKKSFDDITLMGTELERSGITSVDDIELIFKAINPETYETLFETGPIQFKTNK